MRTRSLLLLAVVGGAALYAYTEHREWFSRDRADRPRVDRPTPGGDTVEPRIPDQPVGGPPLAPPPSGEELEVALLGAPARWYARPEDGEGGADDYAELVGEIAAEIGAGEVLFDGHLARAAREVAYQTGVRGHAPPEAAMAFLLHSAGAPELSASQFFTHTTSEDGEVVEESLRRAIENGPGGRGPLRIGVGEVFTPDSTYTRHVSVLVTRRAYEVDPTPRTASLGGTWTLRGTLPPGYRDPVASILYTDGRIGSAEIAVSGRRFEVTAAAGDEVGTIYVGISGTGASGPGKLLQLSVEVGRPPPTKTVVLVPEKEDSFASIEAAEEYALALLNSDRARFGLTPLTPDPALVAVARAHSEDMRDNRFFGHLSPTTGLVGERLERAGYRALTHGENLARNDTLAEAEASLMMSVGHRRNILTPVFTHGGVGLAILRRDDRIEWYVTQVFATPVTTVDVVEMRAGLLERINRDRKERGLEPVVLDSAVSAVAQKHARTVADGAFENVAKEVVADLSRYNVSLGVSVAAIYDVAAFAPPDSALEDAVTTLGVGIVQSEDDPQGRTGVIVVTIKGTPE